MSHHRHQQQTPISRLWFRQANPLTFHMSMPSPPMRERTVMPWWASSGSWSTPQSCHRCGLMTGDRACSLPPTHSTMPSLLWCLPMACLLGCRASCSKCLVEVENKSTPIPFAWSTGVQQSISVSAAPVNASLCFNRSQQHLHFSSTRDTAAASTATSSTGCAARPAAATATTSCCWFATSRQARRQV